MAFQIQTSYRGKIRQFYLERELGDYSSLVESIVINISSLFGVAFQIQYLNDEHTWITLSESPEDIQDLFRCATFVETAEFRRIKLKIVEGCSPAVDVEKKKNKDDDDAGSQVNWPSKRRKLFETDQSEYRTPIEMDIDRKGIDIRNMENELSVLEQQYMETASKYPSDLRRPGSKQCGKCHLYTNHRKNNCPNDICVTAEMCGDISKHPDETSELRDIESRKVKLSNELRKERQELQTKIKCAEKINASFSKRMELELIESDKRKYLVSTTVGLKPRQALLNEHVAILEKHYNGRVPPDVKVERQYFASIIEKSMSAITKRRSTNPNPIYDLLSNSPVYNVQFPGRVSAGRASAAPSPSDQMNPPLPPGPPPPYDQYTQMPVYGSFDPRYTWTPWMMAVGGQNTDQSGPGVTEKNASKDNDDGPA